jgi:hypothetical protein
MATKSKSYLRLHEEVKLSLRGLTVMAYTKRNRYLGRVEINAAGLSAHTGRKGGLKLGNMSWEKFFERLQEE